MSVKGEQHGPSTYPSLVNQSSIFIAKEHVKTDVVNSSMVDIGQNRHVISQRSQRVQSSPAGPDSGTQTGYEDDVSRMSSNDSWINVVIDIDIDGS
jgi:hypothetical protein